MPSVPLQKYNLKVTHDVGEQIFGLSEPGLVFVEKYLKFIIYPVFRINY